MDVNPFIWLSTFYSDGKVAVWEELSTRCISTLKSFAEGVNKINKEMSAHSPSIYRKLLEIGQSVLILFSLAPPSRPFNSCMSEDKHFSKVSSEQINLSSILYNALNKVCTGAILLTISSYGIVMKFEFGSYLLILIKCQGF